MLIFFDVNLWLFYLWINVLTIFHIVLKLLNVFVLRFFCLLVTLLVNSVRYGSTLLLMTYEFVTMSHGHLHCTTFWTTSRTTAHYWTISYTCYSLCLWWSTSFSKKDSIWSFLIIIIMFLLFSFKLNLVLLIFPMILDYFFNIIWFINIYQTEFVEI